MIRRTMLFGAAALAVAAFSADLSQATAPGSNGRIAFNRYELHDRPLTAHILVGGVSLRRAGGIPRTQEKEER